MLQAFLNKNWPGMTVAAVIIFVSLFVWDVIDPNTGNVKDVPGTNRTIIQAYEYKNQKYNTRHREAMEYYREGNLRKMEEFMRDIVRQAPDEPKALHALAVSLTLQDQNDEAEILFNKILTIDPESAPALKGLGGVWRDRGDIDRAIDYYKLSIAKWPNYVPAHYALAVLYDRNNQPAPALPHYEKVRKFAPGTSFAVKSDKAIVRIKQSLN